LSTALAAANGFAFQTSGDSAYRDLRSPGTSNFWRRQMGRAALVRIHALNGKIEDRQFMLVAG
jgi:hypothetical protein